MGSLFKGRNLSQGGGEVYTRGKVEVGGKDQKSLEKKGGPIFPAQMLGGRTEIFLGGGGWGGWGGNVVAGRIPGWWLGEEPEVGHGGTKGRVPEEVRGVGGGGLDEGTGGGPL